MTAVPRRTPVGDGRFIDPYEMPDPKAPLAATSPLKAPASQARPTEETLDAVRGWITDLDRRIVSLLAQRQRLARRTLTSRGRTPEALYDPAREAAVVREVAERGATLGLDPRAVRDLYGHFVALCRLVPPYEG
jgi:chorismate mutase